MRSTCNPVWRFARLALCSRVLVTLFFAVRGCGVGSAFADDLVLTLNNSYNIVASGLRCGNSLSKDRKSDRVIVGFDSANIRLVNNIIHIDVLKNDSIYETFTLASDESCLFNYINPAANLYEGAYKPSVRNYVCHKLPICNFGSAIGSATSKIGVNEYTTLDPTLPKLYDVYTPNDMNGILAGFYFIISPSDRIVTDMEQ